MKINPPIGNLIINQIRIHTRGKYSHATLTIPPSFLKKKGIKDGERIIVVYLCKEDGEPEEEQSGK